MATEEPKKRIMREHGFEFRERTFLISKMISNQGKLESMVAIHL